MRTTQSNAVENTKKEEEKSVRIWGRVIDVNSFTPGSCLRILALVIAIFVVPIQLFCDGYVKLKEQDMILRL